MGQDDVTIQFNPDGFAVGLRRGSMTRLLASGLEGSAVLKAIPKLLEILTIETNKERDVALRKMIEARGGTGEP